MRIPRIFQNICLAIDTIIALNADATHYISHVLRLKPGASLCIFNGRGGEYNGTLIALNKQKAQVQLEQFNDRNIESPLKIHLGQGISRGEKMDFIIQKSVELGVTAITPLITHRCGVQLSEARWQKRLEHWQKIANSACEQCQRTIVPMINPPQLLADWLNQISREQVATGSHPYGLVLNPTATLRLNNLDKTGVINLLIGPEGGLEDSEIRLATQYDFQQLNLGPRILRTETAGLAILAALQAKWGDL